MRSRRPACPAPVAQVARLMSAYDRWWALCGGWAVDAWLGRQTREHGDVDVTVLQGDQRAMFEHLAGWQLVAHDPNVPGDTDEAWNGRRLDLPAHIHAGTDAAAVAAWVGMRSSEGLRLELVLSAHEGADLVIEAAGSLSMPLERSTAISDWGVPTLVPEVVLLFKADNPRPRDEQDFAALLPGLTRGQRDFLEQALRGADPGHDWLSRLAPG